MQSRLIDVQHSISEQIKESPTLRGIDPETALQHTVCGLAEEAGEVAGLLKREVFRDNPQPRERWCEELGDTMWYLVATATVLDISLDEIWEYNIRKLEERYGIR